MRTLGVAVTYTNTASTLNNQGKVTANQIPEGEMWYDWTSYNTVTQTLGKWDDNVKKGVNGWLKFTQLTDTDLKSYTKVQEGEIYDSYWPIDEPPAFLVFVLKISDTAGREGMFLHRWLTNYTTTDTFREVDSAEYSSGIFRSAAEVMKNATQFSENPSHWKKIQKFAKDAARAVVKYGPMVYNGASMVAQMA